MYLIELTFGHCRSDGEPLPLQQVTLAEQKALKFFCQCFRGGQAQHLGGGYLTADNRLLTEPSTVIKAYSQEVEQHVAYLLALAREIAYSLSQECVLLTIVRLQGTMQWVEPEVTAPLAKQPAMASSLSSYSETV